jgi:hypothetical protein
MFHPDNIKNYSPHGGKVSVSLHDFWAKIGGGAGLAAGLKSDIKVTN